MPRAAREMECEEPRAWSPFVIDVGSLALIVLEAVVCFTIPTTIWWVLLPHSESADSEFGWDLTVILAPSGIGLASVVLFLLSLAFSRPLLPRWLLTVGLAAGLLPTLYFLFLGITKLFILVILLPPVVAGLHFIWFLWRAPFREGRP